jgi:hypothetical protein
MYRDGYGLEGPALQYISECISSAPQMRIYYGEYERVRGIRHLKYSTLYKTIGILQHKNFSKGRFFSDICAGQGGPRSYAKARIDSLYHFMPLTEELDMDASYLYAILLGLPHNRKRFVNCALPVRRAEVEAFIRFTDALLKSDHRRGISIIENNEVRINSTELCDLISGHYEDIDRIIDLYVHEEAPLGRVIECMKLPLALQDGAL